jgi:leucyl aminopeptidase
MDGTVKNLYLVGVGKSEEKNASVSVRFAVAELMRKIKHDCKNVLINIPFIASAKDKKNLSSAIGEGIELGLYSFDKYKTKKEDEEDKRKLETVFIAGVDDESLSKGIIFA